MSEQFKLLPLNFLKMANFLERVKSFNHALAAYHKNGAVLVDQNTANIRANICTGCHNNVPDGEARSGCALCGGAEKVIVDQVSKTILQGRVTTHNSSLKACNICGCDNKLAVWFPQEYLLKKHDQNAYPTFCWKKEPMP